MVTPKGRCCVIYSIWNSSAGIITPFVATNVLRISYIIAALFLRDLQAILSSTRWTFFSTLHIKFFLCMCKCNYIKVSFQYLSFKLLNYVWFDVTTSETSRFWIQFWGIIHVKYFTAQNGKFVKLLSVTFSSGHPAKFFQKMTSQIF